eukprot:11436238-Ditylum_brightwellii.AAC.1
MELLAEATHTTTADLKVIKTKLATVPTDPADYIFGLKNTPTLSTPYLVCYHHYSGITKW